MKVQINNAITEYLNNRGSNKENAEWGFIKNIVNIDAFFAKPGTVEKKPAHKKMVQLEENLKEGNELQIENANEYYSRNQELLYQQNHSHMGQIQIG